jgi:hypothetical protein
MARRASETVFIGGAPGHGLARLVQLFGSYSRADSPHSWQSPPGLAVVGTLNEKV